MNVLILYVSFARVNDNDFCDSNLNLLLRINGDNYHSCD